ncbi:MAG: NAD(P)H-dependent glycerol-3-phosphate dehydrogenase [Candidatus Paceibacterota bacterium]
MKIAILGGGIYGSAMASYLSGIGHNVSVDTIDGGDMIFVCASSNMVLPSLLKFEKEITDQKIIICSKGFAGDGRLISEALKEKFINEVFFLYGPTLAEELGKGSPSCMVLAGGEGKEEIKKQIESENLRIDLSDDVVGVEISAALKNVMTILIGIVEGAGYGQNTKAYVFTKTIQETKDIGLALGGKIETFLGLSCIGDFSLPSRNRFLGIELGKGYKLEEIVRETNYTPAGVYALKDAKKMVEKLGIDAPLIRVLYKIVFENYSIKEAIKEID